MRTILVVALLVLSASAYAQSTNQQPSAKRVQEQPESTAPSPQPPINITVNVPEPDPQIAKSEAEDRAANLQIQGLIGAATVLIAIVTLGQVIFGYLAFRTSDKAARAAEKSAEVASASLQMADRPWISLQDLKIKKMNVTEHGDVELVLLMTIRNLGRSVALHIDLHIFAMPAEFETTDVAEQRNVVWARSKAILHTHKPQMGFALFPNEPMNREVRLVIDAKEWHRIWTKQMPFILKRPMHERAMPIVVFGALMYGQSVPTKLRTTSFCFEVRRIDPTGQGLDLAPLAVTTPGENLRLVVSSIGMHHAD